MANKLFDVETGLKIGDSYWFSGNGNIIASGTIVAGNIQVTGATAVTNIQYENTVYQYATNLSSPNVFITGGSLGVGTDGTVSEMANLYAQLGRFGSLSIANALITGASATTLVATNFSSGNIYQSAADTFVATNFSSGNARVTGGSVTGITGAASTLQTSNFSTGNATITGSTTTIGIAAGGSASPIANLYASGVGNFGSITTANVLMTGDITQSATGTFSYDARTLAPKQYIDVMSVVFGT